MDQRRRRRRRGRRQTRRRRKRNLLLKMIILIILIVGTIAALLLWKKYGPSKETADLNKYYGVENDNQLAIVVNNQIIDPKGMITDGKAYVEYSVVRDYINERFYWDPNENTLLYTLPNGVVSVGVGSKDYSVGKEKNSEEYVIVKTEGSTAYIALDFVKQYTNMDFEVYDKPSRVMVNTETGSVDVAQVKRDTQVRYQGGVKSPILTEVKKNDKIEILWNTIVTKIDGDEVVEGLHIQDVDNHVDKLLDVDGIFIAVGTKPASELLSGKLSTDEKGYIIAGEDGVTNIPGIFAAGDGRSKNLRQVVTAVSDGANCVYSVERYLQNA